jgi:hypothetical protein
MASKKKTKSKCMLSLGCRSREHLIYPSHHSGVTMNWVASMDQRQLVIPADWQNLGCNLASFKMYQRLQTFLRLLSV